MSDRTWEDIGNEIRDDYLRDGGPENVRFREVQWEAWIAEVERAAAARALDQIADILDGYAGTILNAESASDIVRARAAEIREKKSE